MNGLRKGVAREPGDASAGNPDLLLAAKHLLNGTASLFDIAYSLRYDSFVSQVRGQGPPSFSSILPVPISCVSGRPQ
jgi:hypothetical protein